MSGKIVLLAGLEAEPDDRALLAACAEGNEEALKLLFRRHQPVIRRFVSRIMGGRQEDVDDVVQTTFLEAWRSAEAFAARSTVRAWLLGIAANVSRRHHRGRTRRERFLALLARRPVPPGPLDPCEALTRQQLVERVRAGLSELPHAQRVAYVLCELEELPGTEAAAAVGVKPGTMWRRLHEARKALREMLERDEGTP